MISCLDFLQSNLGEGRRMGRWMKQDWPSVDHCWTWWWLRESSLCSTPYLFECVQDEIFKSLFLFFFKAHRGNMLRELRRISKDTDEEVADGKVGLEGESRPAGQVWAETCLPLPLAFCPCWSVRRDPERWASACSWVRLGWQLETPSAPLETLSHGLPAIVLQAHLLIKSHSANVLAQNINVLKKQERCSPYLHVCSWPSHRGPVWTCMWRGGGGGILSSEGGVRTGWKERVCIQLLASKHFYPLCWEIRFTFSFYLFWEKRYQKPGPWPKEFWIRGPSGTYRGEEKKTGFPPQPRAGRRRWGQRGRQRLRSSLPLPAPSRIRLEGFPGGASGKEFTCQCRRCQRQGSDSLGWEDPLEEDIATHSSILAWRSPRTEEPGGLQSLGMQRGRHDWAHTTALGIFRKVLKSRRQRGVAPAPCSWL